MAQVYVISNASKKSGKTTTALNLALCLIAMGKKVLLKTFKTNGQLANIFKSDNYTQHLLTFKRNGAITQDICNYYDYVLIDVDFHNLDELRNILSIDYTFIIPFISEFYGFEGLKTFLNYTEKHKLKITGILPVFVKSSEVSTNILEELRANLGNLVLDAFIPRNFYLAKQFDYEVFNIETFTNKAGITYLNLATELNDRNEKLNAE